MEPGVLAFLGGIINVLGFSARSSYEDLDQNVPSITWSTVALQWMALALVAWAIWSAGDRGTFAYIGIAGALAYGVLVALDAVTDNSAVALLQMGALVALAVGVGGGAAWPTVIALGAVATMHTVQWVLLPYEERRRVVYGPGMALLPLAWLALAYALSLSASAGSPGAYSPSAYSPGAYTPGAYSPSSYSPSVAVAPTYVSNFV